MGADLQAEMCNTQVGLPPRAWPEGPVGGARPWERGRVRATVIRGLHQDALATEGCCSASTGTSVVPTYSGTSLQCPHPTCHRPTPSSTPQNRSFLPSAAEFTSHKIKHVKGGIQWLLVHSRCCATTTSIKSKKLLSPQSRTPDPLSCHSPLPSSSPWQRPASFVSGCVCLDVSYKWNHSNSVAFL